ncbi:MAG: DUF4169 family protein [Sphingobium sp.]
MGDVINLRQARKRLARRTAEDKAAENRARHGLTNAEKLRQRDEAGRQARRIDGARREGQDAQGDGADGEGAD